MSENASNQQLEPCKFCGGESMIEEFRYGDDPQPLFVATCKICPVKTYDQFTPEEAARIWNSRAPVGVAVDLPEGQWQHVQIKAGNPRVVAIQFETAEQATAFINSFAATAFPAAPKEEARDLIAYKWAETLSEGEQSVLLTSSLRRLRDMINAATTPSPDAARHYFCSCGGALTAEEYIEHYFEKGHDRGEPQLLARAAAKEIQTWLGVSSLVDGEGMNEVSEIIQRHCFSAETKEEGE